jgi:hypothetical protein
MGTSLRLTRSLLRVARCPIKEVEHFILFVHEMISISSKLSLHLDLPQFTRSDFEHPPLQLY